MSCVKFYNINRICLYTFYYQQWPLSTASRHYYFKFQSAIVFDLTEASSPSQPTNQKSLQVSQHEQFYYNVFLPTFPLTYLFKSTLTLPSLVHPQFQQQNVQQAPVAQNPSAVPAPPPLPVNAGPPAPPLPPSGANAGGTLNRANDNALANALKNATLRKTSKVYRNLSNKYMR